MPWIKVYGEIWESWKIPKLCDTLQIGEAQAIGHLVSLWCFAERNAWQDGDLEKWGAIGVAKAARWTLDPEDFVKAMRIAHFFDDNSLKIHAWTEHQAGMIHDRERRNPRQIPAESPRNPRQIPAESPRNPRLDKIREDKSREDKKLPLAQSDSENEQNLYKPLETLPLPGGSLYTVTDKDMPLWVKAYPGVDIMQELAKMKVWLNANPTRRKTERGMGRFITSWLERAQNSGKGAETGARTGFQGRGGIMTPESRETYAQALKEREIRGGDRK